MRKQFADPAHGVQCSASPEQVSRAAADGAADAVRNMQRGSGTGRRSGRRARARPGNLTLYRTLHRAICGWIYNNNKAAFQAL